MSDIKPVKLGTEQIADLMEVGNIGAGNAASALSDLIHRRCVIDIPQITYVAADASDNDSSAEARVRVPKNRGRAPLPKQAP